MYMVIVIIIIIIIMVVYNIAPAPAAISRGYRLESETRSDGVWYIFYNNVIYFYIIIIVTMQRNIYIAV